MTDIERLLPCPFCGGPAHYFEWEDNNKPIGQGEYHNIICGNLKCPIGELVVSEHTVEEAAKAWNTRAHDADYERLRGMEERVKGAAVGEVTHINAMPPRRTPEVTVKLRLQDNLDPPLGQTVALVPVTGGE